MAKVIGGLLVVVILGWGGLSLSPAGAVRVNLLTSGHPILASTVRITKNDYQKDRTPWTKRGDYLINHPIVTETGAEIDEFSIQHHGIFYTATQNYRASFWALKLDDGVNQHFEATAGESNGLAS